MTQITIRNGAGYEKMDIDVTKLTKDMLSVKMETTTQEIRRKRFMRALERNDVEEMIQWAWTESGAKEAMPVFAHKYTM